jgi:hypothetical protein
MEKRLKSAQLDYEEEDEITCGSCDAEFTLVYKTDQDGVLYAPEYCPFCGDPLDLEDNDDDNEDEEYIDED